MPHSSWARRRFGAGMLAAACAPAIAGITNERTLMSFPGQDWFCESCQTPPTLATDGLLYGTLVVQGAHGLGVLYAIDTARQGSKVLYDFTAEAGHPVGYLTVGIDGAFYGITRSGGRLGGGTAYRLSRAGHLKILHDFAPGETPVSLMQASDGGLYGTTDAGGVDGLGSIFRLDADGHFEELHSFSATGPRGSPAGMQLAEAFDYRLYGVSSVGGDNGTGAVYSYGLHDGTFAVTYSFGPAGSGDAASPNSRLAESLNGTLYGTSDAGGADQLGTIYHVSVFGEESVVHAFTGREGAHPVNGVTQNPDSTLYGVAQDGGAGAGTAWRVSATGKFGLLYEFGTKHTDGRSPAGFTWGIDGQLYGLCYLGGKYDSGTFFGFRLKPER